MTEAPLQHDGRAGTRVAFVSGVRSAMAWGGAASSEDGLAESPGRSRVAVAGRGRVNCPEGRWLASQAFPVRASWLCAKLDLRVPTVKDAGRAPSHPHSARAPQPESRKAAGRQPAVGSAENTPPWGRAGPGLLNPQSSTFPTEGHLAWMGNPSSKEQLLDQVRKMQERCPQTLFIFDEAEKLHPALLDALGSHLEPWAPEDDRAESPRAIFLFLSNLGGNIINNVVLDLLKAGRSREEITLEHLAPHLQAALLAATDSGFGHSRLLKENLIDFFVPFLPLEYRHVRLCARDAFLTQELPYTEEVLDEIAKMVVYVPKEEQRFSSQGCKSIAQRINYFLP